MVPGEKNIQAQLLVERSKIVFPPLRIKLGVMKQFVKALNKEGACFKYICSKFPGLAIKKLKAGIFNGPQIRKLMNDHEFPSSMSKEEFYAWDAFVKVVKNFFGNKKASNYKELVANLLSSFEDIGAKMSIKVISCTVILIAFLKIWVHLVMNKEKDSIKTLRKWKRDIKGDGMPSC